MNPLVDNYFKVGCGRCALGGTPQCKVHLYPKGLKYLRQILLDCGLQEELKWSVPCYTHQQKNVVILAAFKNYFSLSFFKGALLQDPNKLLQAPGEHTQVNRLLKFTASTHLPEYTDQIKAFVFEAMALEDLPQKPNKSKTTTKISVPEWDQTLKQTPVLKKAFNALSPGRQRAYLIYFSSAKQTQTRLKRIQQYVPYILQGKGMNDV